MADSEVSTTLPAVSRRQFISTSLVASTASFLPLPAGLHAEAHEAADPAVLAWGRWEAAHRKSIALCRKQQRLETKLHRSIGQLHVIVVPPGTGTPIRISSLRDLDRLIDSDPSAAILREEISAKFDAHRKRWNEADQRLGYSAALEQETMALDREQQLAATLWSTPSFSLDGIAAKLDALVRSAEPSEGCEEFPWPQLRLITGDLGRVAHRATRNGPTTA